MTDDLDGPACDTCGKTTCPDADAPQFEEPRACAYLPIYNELRYDRCDYGCGRDITKAAIQRDIVPHVDRMLAAALAQGAADERTRIAWWLRRCASGPGSATEDYRNAVVDLAVIVEQHPDRWLEAPVVRP